MPRVFKNHPDRFCYVCGELTLKSERKPLSLILKTAYKFYFGCQVGGQDKDLAPRVCCTTCYSSLTKWLKDMRKSMSFALPMVWREPRSHLTDFYFCMTSTVGFSSKSKHSIQYSNIPSSIKPIPHKESLPIPEPPKTYPLEPKIDLKDFEQQPGPSDTSTDDEECSDDSADRQPHLVTQSESNDLVRDLELPKRNINFFDLDYSSGIS